MGVYLTAFGSEHLTGTDGDDTLEARAGPATLTGAGGADLFRYIVLPYSAGHVTDFTVGTDHLDLETLLKNGGYPGSDPIADRWVTLESDGAGGTKLFLDFDGPAGSDTINYLITTLDHVAPNTIAWSQISAPRVTQIGMTGGSTGQEEGASGLSAAPFSVTRWGPVQGTTTVQWRVTSSGSPDSAQPSDFPGGVFPSGTLTFGPGEMAKTIMVNAAGDTISEPGEGYRVELFNVSGAVLVYPDAFGTIYDDDSGIGPISFRDISFAVNNVTFNSNVTLPEGNDASTAYTFQVVRSGPLNGVATVKWAVSGSGPHPADAADFVGGTLPSGVLSFADGENSKTIVVNVAGDRALELEEGFAVKLSEATGVRTTQNATTLGVIRNDDAAGGPPPPPPPPPGDGQVITGNDTPGQALTGGAGNDTLIAGHNSVVETGGAGADAFVFRDLPWNAGRVTDFTVGTDRLDLSALLQASGYSGSDPIADGYVTLTRFNDATRVFYDTDGRASGNTIQFTITTLENVPTAGLTWAKLTQPGGQPPPPPPPGGGVVLRADDTPGQHLTGGAGNDTLHAGHNSVILTGAGGADHFVYDDLPWNAGHITDFVSLTDKIDISPLIAASHYTGSDPFADGYLRLENDGAGGIRVIYDTDGRASGNTIPFLITTVDHTTQLAVSDFIFH